MSSNKQIYDIKDVMRIMNISKGTAYKLIKSGEIPYKLIGNRYKIPTVGFNRWLNDYDNSLQEPNICDTINFVISGEQTRPVINERSAI